VLEPFYRQLEFTRQPQSGVQLRLTRETQQSQAWAQTGPALRVYYV